MPQNPPGLRDANTQTANKRDKAKDQGLAEQNVTGASPPEVDKEADTGTDERNPPAGKH